jgi:hypothetical protein
MRGQAEIARKGNLWMSKEKLQVFTNENNITITSQF